MRANAVVRIFLAVLGFWLSIGARLMVSSRAATPALTELLDLTAAAKRFFKEFIKTQRSSALASDERLSGEYNKLPNSAPQSGQAPSG